MRAMPNINGTDSASVRPQTFPAGVVVLPVLLSSCSMNHYVLKKTLSKHYDSINTLAFSQDGSLFASGGDDGLVIIFQGHGSGQEIRRFQIKAPVTTLLWHSRFGYTVVAGDTSGDVHTLCIQKSEKVSVSCDHILATST